MYLAHLELGTDAWFVYLFDDGGRMINIEIMDLLLHIPKNEYKKFLLKHSIEKINGINSYFNTEEDAKNFIEEIEPYLIMKKLSE